MYSFPFRAPDPKKWAIGIGTYVFVGMYLPWFAFGFSQRKAAHPARWARQGPHRNTPNQELHPTPSGLMTRKHKHTMPAL